MSAAQPVAADFGEPVVATDNVDLQIDEHRTVQVLAGTQVPPVYVEAYRAATGKPARKGGRPAKD